MLEWWGLKGEKGKEGRQRNARFQLHQTGHVCAVLQRFDTKLPFLHSDISARERRPYPSRVLSTASGKPSPFGSGPCGQRSRLQLHLINNAKRAGASRGQIGLTCLFHTSSCRSSSRKRYLLLKYQRTCELNLGIKHSTGSSKRPQPGPSEATSTWIGPQGPVRGLPSPNGCQFCLPQQGSRRKKKGRKCPARSAGAGGGNPSHRVCPPSTSGIAIANRLADRQRSGLDGEVRWSPRLAPCGCGRVRLQVRGRNLALPPRPSSFSPQR